MQVRIQHLKDETYMLFRPLTDDERVQMIGNLANGDTVILKLSKSLVDRLTKDLLNGGENGRENPNTPDNSGTPKD